MAEDDLVKYARDAASRGDDLFALLATDATASEADIRRAFRRKALTAHPDKAGDAFDPALYERLERARDVLLNPAAREAYDSGMRAVLQKKMQMEQMSLKRRQLVEDLERREEEAKRAKTAPGPQAQDAELAAMAARGRAKMEEMRRRREEAEARERLAKEREAAAAAAAAAATSQDGQQKAAQGGAAQVKPLSSLADYDERIADLERQLEEKRQRKAEKAQRKADKAKSAGTPSSEKGPSDGNNNNNNNNNNNPPPSQPPPSPPPTTAGSQADQDKVSTAAPSAPSTDALPSGNPPKASDRFASTLARLKAAQAKKEAEKKKRAEEEARAAS
ncbi:hypothetical protein VTK26DRAFT_7239 [Humicola hyalothermophila]